MHGSGWLRIASRPYGEAPEWVRDCWVGLELPLAGPPRKFLGAEVLSGPKTFWSGLKMVLTGRARTYTGYPVDAEKAVAILELNSPHAAKWWRGNCPHLIGKGQLFIFDLDCANAA